MNRLFERLKEYLLLKTTTKQSVGAYMDGYADGWKDGMKNAIETLEKEIKEEGYELPEKTTTEGENDTHIIHFPSHGVTFEMVSVGDFMIGKFPVTQKQWRAIMGSNPSYFKGCDDCPVENVSYHDAERFIEKFNETPAAKEVYSTFKRKFRLPTEQEWEFAAKGGYKSKGYEYSVSNNIDDVAWYSGNSEGRTHPVGEKAPNELGLYDMSGNVWEWCESSGSDRALRGGSWLAAAVLCRVAFRGSAAPALRYSSVGFRFAL